MAVTFIRQIVDNIVNFTLYGWMPSSTDYTVDGQESPNLNHFKEKLSEKLQRADAASDTSQATLGEVIENGGNTQGEVNIAGDHELIIIAKANEEDIEESRFAIGMEGDPSRPYVKMSFVKSNGNVMEIKLNDSGMFITDEGNTGIKYAGDYSAGFEGNSLVDKDTVAAMIAAALP